MFWIWCIWITTSSNTWSWPESRASRVSKPKRRFYSTAWVYSTHEYRRTLYREALCIIKYRDEDREGYNEQASHVFGWNVTLHPADLHCKAKHTCRLFLHLYFLILGPKTKMKGQKTWSFNPAKFIGVPSWNIWSCGVDRVALSQRH